MTFFSYSFKIKFLFKEISFSLQLFIIVFLLLKIYNITLDPDPNWTKVLDPDPNSMYVFGSCTVLGCEVATCWVERGAGRAWRCVCDSHRSHGQPQGRRGAATLPQVRPGGGLPQDQHRESVRIFIHFLCTQTSCVLHISWYYIP